MTTRYPGSRRAGSGLWVVAGVTTMVLVCFGAGAASFRLAAGAAGPAGTGPTGAARSEPADTGTANAGAPNAGGPNTGGPNTGAVSAGAAPAGTPVRDGKFEFVVERMECGVTRIESEALHDTAQGQFCLVGLAITNIGSKPRAFTSTGQQAYNAAGDEYDSDTEATLYANTEHQVWFNNINPGNTLHGVVVFDIPTDAAITELELHDSWFSDGVRVAVA